MERYLIVHDNVKIHFNNEKSVKDYLARFGKGKIAVYESKLVFERTANSIKIDRL